MPSVCSECGAFGVSTSNDFEFNLATLARLAQLSATNEPPRDAELSLIGSIVEKTSARLAALDTEICRLKDRLEELEKERIALSVYHAQNRRVLSPLRRLPPEILGEIFSWTLPSIHHPAFSTTSCPWGLTYICRTWRAVALSDPSLWSVIQIDFSAEEQYPRELVGLQMERAQSLEIHFVGCETVDSTPQIATFTLLSEHSSRWEVLSIQLTADLIPHLMAIRNGLTALRKAWVQWDTVKSQLPEFNSVDFFPMAISLVDIGVNSEYRFLRTRLPILNQLTRYDFDAPWDAHIQLLKSLPNLREVRIRRQFDDDHGWPELGESIKLLQLRRLYVNDPTILAYLRAPALTEITIGISEMKDTSRPLERLLTQSPCAPRKLRIEGLLDVQSMVEILQKHLSFNEIAITSTQDEDEDTQRGILANFLTLFTVLDFTPSAMISPHITEIDFACEKADAMLYPLFLNMLESRWNAQGSSLKAAELFFPDPLACPDPKSIARAGKLREAGLRISLSSGDEAEARIAEWLLRTSWWV
ncbi:F-box domain-containing protein [Mycena sanguinolenta]|uniref:F-box domain-containing protein n=1 Tax=Mycena sanguinolenta TaxID=230812 RepID=A0A8H7CPA7_9AGAR|nr:F-box domain-containing protein [Mycena sanguinolenta]